MASSERCVHVRGGVIGITIALLAEPGWESADDWAALVASAIIAYNGVLLIRPALCTISWTNAGKRDRSGRFVVLLKLSATCERWRS
jgi:hypothetical protein